MQYYIDPSITCCRIMNCKKSYQGNQIFSISANSQLDNLLNCKDNQYICLVRHRPEVSAFVWAGKSWLLFR